MEPPALEFVEEPYDDDTLNALITGFQKTGYAVLPNVFERQSVDPFLKQLQAAVYHDGIEYGMPDDALLHVWAAQAPRVRQILVPAMTHTAAAGLSALRHPQFFHPPPHVVVSFNRRLPVFHRLLCGAAAGYRRLRVQLGCKPLRPEHVGGSTLHTLLDCRRADRKWVVIPTCVLRVRCWRCY
jgi:hypothetical protein